MKIGKYYIEDRYTGDIWGKGPGKISRSHCTEGEITEKEAEALERLEDFDTIEEAEEAAAALIDENIPFLAISLYAKWDENATYLLPKIELTNAYGERPKK